MVKLLVKKITGLPPGIIWLKSVDRGLGLDVESRPRWRPFMKRGDGAAAVAVAVADRPMVRRNDVSVKMDADVIADCRIAAAFKGLSLAEYLSETMRAVAKKDIEEGYTRRQKGDHPKPKGKP